LPLFPPDESAVYFSGNSKNILLDCDSKIKTIGVILMCYYNTLLYGMQQTTFASEKPGRCRFFANASLARVRSTVVFFNNN
jgi:hypothetical protein